MITLYLQIKHNLLEPIVTVFMANGERYNLLNSVVLEMFDFIRKEGIKSLIDYFVDKLYHQVEDVDYDATFLKIKDKFEQSLESQGTQSAAASTQLQTNRLRRDERALDRGQIFVDPSHPVLRIKDRQLFVNHCTNKDSLSLQILYPVHINCGARSLWEVKGWQKVGSCAVLTKFKVRPKYIKRGRGDKSLALRSHSINSCNKSCGRVSCLCFAEEERFFDEDDDEEEQPQEPFADHESNGAMNFMPRGLVDYDDDDDEDQDLAKAGTKLCSHVCTLQHILFFEQVLECIKNYSSGIGSL